MPHSPHCHLARCPWFVQAGLGSALQCLQQAQTAVHVVELLHAVLNAPAGRQLSSNTRLKLLLGAKPVFALVPESLNWVAAGPLASLPSNQGLDADSPATK